MIGHQHVGIEFDWIFLQSFFKHSQERLVVVVLMKDGLPPIPTIQGMVDSSRFVRSLLPRHKGHSLERLAGPP
jgi:hypothetical protein